MSEQNLTQSQLYFQLLILFLLVSVPPSQTLFSFDHIGRSPLNGCKKNKFHFFLLLRETKKTYWALNNENVALGTQSPWHSVALSTQSLGTQSLRQSVA